MGDFDNAMFFASKRLMNKQKAKEEIKQMNEQDKEFIKDLGDRLEATLRRTTEALKASKKHSSILQGAVDKHNGEVKKEAFQLNERLDQHRDTINENFATTDKRLNAHRDRIKTDFARTKEDINRLDGRCNTLRDSNQAITNAANKQAQMMDALKGDTDELEEVVDRNETDIEYVSERVRKIEKKLDAWKPLLDERKNYFFDEISAIKRAVNAINLRQQAPLIVVDTDSSGALSDDVPSTNAPTPVEKRYFVYQDVMTPGIKRFYVMDSRKKWPAIHKSKTNNRAVAECICKIMNEAEHYHRESGNDIYFGRQNNEESTQYILLEIQKTSPMVFPIRYKSVMRFDVQYFTEAEVEEIRTVIISKTER